MDPNNTCYICEEEFDGLDKIVTFINLSYHAEVKLSKENYHEANTLHIDDFHENGRFLMDETKKFHPHCFINLLRLLPLKIPEVTT